MKRLFFVRHGLTEMNVAGTFCGQTETSLTDKGISQARQTAEHIQTQLPRIDLIICSPSERAVHTAEIIVSHNASFCLRDSRLSLS